VASEIGTVSSSTLFRIERGETPEIETFLRLCDWLHQSTSAFIRSDSRNLDTNELTQLVAQALRADGVLSPHVIDAFLTLIKAIRLQKRERPNTP
jgi:transcriptional regulator with XRE-family HTH domain